MQVQQYKITYCTVLLVSSMNYGNHDPILKVAHTRMKAYLIKQEELMEQRIK